MLDVYLTRVRSQTTAHGSPPRHPLTIAAPTAAPANAARPRPAPARAASPSSSGTSGPPTTSCSRSRTTPAPPTTSRRPIAPGWPTARRGCERELGDATELYGKELCVVLAGLAVDRPEVTDAASLVELLGRSPDDTIVRLIMGEDLRDPDRAETAERAIAGDPEAIEAMLEHVGGQHGKDGKTWLTTLYARAARR